MAGSLFPQFKMHLNKCEHRKINTAIILFTHFILTIKFTQIFIHIGDYHVVKCKALKKM